MGPQLAEHINDPQPKEVGVDEDYGDNNPSSIFLRAAKEKEIIDIVSKCKNKTSTDWNEIDMTIVKKVINGIVNPLTYICNLSFKTGTFPCKIKTTKVIPLYKAGD